MGVACADEIPEGCVEKDNYGEVLTPNVYFMLDASGSMKDCVGSSTWLGCDSQGTLWEALNDALDQKKTDLSNNFNVGFGTFPGPIKAGAYERFHSYIDLTETSVYDYSKITKRPDGGTFIVEALEIMKTNKYYDFEGDTESDRRAKAVVVVTDAKNKSDMGLSDEFDIDDAITNTAALAADGVKVFYMGFAGVNETQMQQLALAGKGLASSDEQEWYKITNTDSIIAALNDISTSMVPCDAEVDLEGNDPDTINVYLKQGDVLSLVDKANWTFDEATSTVTLNEEACEDLHDYLHDNPGAQALVAVRIPCAAQQSECIPTGAEICDDDEDNDCNGFKDDGCGQNH